jgi:hypothetical protein
MYEGITLQVKTNTPHQALLRAVEAGKKLNVLPGSDTWFLVGNM